MPVYINLIKFTSKGIENIKDSPKRVEEAQKLAKAVGGELKKVYYTMGQYDMVAISEGPSNESMMKALFILGSAGAIRTETLVAFSAEKAAEIIKGLP